MREIIISDPQINRDPFRDHAYQVMDPYERREFVCTFAISPETHPLVADVCAGDGGYARILVDKGWDSSNITCIDRCRTETPLVPGVEWRYWDIEKLGWAILAGRTLPDVITSYNNKFDLVILVNGMITRGRIADAVCNFLVRDGGRVIC